MSLHVTVGCMFAGKSTKALNIIRKYKAINKNVLIINHKLNTRNNPNEIFTHDSFSAECSCESEKELMTIVNTDKFKESDIIIIEEAQFFEDLYAFCKYVVDELCKTVYVFGLDGDANRNPFGEMCSLCPIANTFEKISAWCQFCKDGTPASFTLCHATLPDSGILIGGQALYSPVCRKHYLQC